MNPITLLTLFFGYLLVYAATANHGRFATDPWSGTIHDAYRDSVDGQAPSEAAYNAQRGNATPGGGPKVA